MKNILKFKNIYFTLNIGITQIYKIKLQLNTKFDSFTFNFYFNFIFIRLIIFIKICNRSKYKFDTFKHR